MKRTNPNIFIAVLMIFVLLFSIMTIYAFGEKKTTKSSISAISAALYLPETKTFVYSKNSNKQMPMASTTKIMTALVALDKAELDETVAVDDSAIGIEGSSAYLRHGDVLSMEELLYALLLQSANDAAVAIACHIGGSLSGFVDLMNEKATEIGLSNTHFTNPHGLDHEDHYTTAEDLAILAAVALENPTFKMITSTYKKSFVSEERCRTYFNHNKLLLRYDGCIGVKTGYTKRSGRCLVSAAERDGLCYIGVTLNAPNDWNDHQAMLDQGFEAMEKISFATNFDHLYKIPVIEGKRDFLVAANTDAASIIVKKSEHEINEYVKLARYVIAPISKGDILGEIIYTLDGKEAARVQIVATESIEKEEKNGLFSKLFSNKQ